MSETKLVPKLRFGEFSDEWESTQLGDVLKINYGKDYKHLEEGNIPVLGTGGVMTHVNDFLYDKPSVLIGRKGTIDKPMYIDSPFWTVDTLFYTDIFGANPKFLYYLFSTINWLKYNEASGVPSLSASNIKKIKSYLPSIKEQLKISVFLSKIDSKIELLNQKLDQTQEFKKYLMQNIFSQKLRFAGFDDEWDIDRIGNYCEVYGRIGFRGYTVDDLVSEGEGALTIGGKHISPDYRLDLSNPEYLSWEKYDESPEIKVFNNDVLLVKTASVGKVCIIEDLKEAATINPQIVVFKNIKINNKFFYYYLISEPFQKDLHRIKTTTGIPTITQKELMNLNMLIPSIEEQNAIVGFLSKVDKKIDYIKIELEQTQEFKKGLLQQMFV